MSIRRETLLRHHVAFKATMGPIDFQLFEGQNNYKNRHNLRSFVDNSQFHFHLVRSSYVLLCILLITLRY